MDNIRWNGPVGWLRGICVLYLLCFLGATVSPVLAEEEVYEVMAEVPGSGDIRWGYERNGEVIINGQRRSFVSGITWELLTRGTHASSWPPPQKGLYFAGCVPTAIGQQMLQLIRYRYPKCIVISKFEQVDHDILPLQVNYYNSITSQNRSVWIFERRRNYSSYHWDKMPDRIPDGEKLEVLEAIETYIAPLLVDIGRYVGASYKLNESGEGKETTVRMYNGEKLMRAFGFKHSIHYGSASNLVTWNPAIKGVWQRRIKQIIETNVDHGHAVVLEVKGHANLIVGYGREKSSDNQARLTKRWRGMSHYLVNGGLAFIPLVENEAKLGINQTYRILFNVFPVIPPELQSRSCERPEILSGLVFSAWPHAPEKKYVRIATGFNEKHYIDVPVNEKTGVYSSAVPPRTRLVLTVLDENKEPHKDYGKMVRYSTKSFHLATLMALGNVHGADFFPPSTVTFVSGLDTPPPALTAQGRTAKVLSREDLLRVFTPQSPSAPVSDDLDLCSYRTVVAASDTELDANALNASRYIEDVVQAKAFVAAGGTVIATGRSSIFPAFMGGVSGPKFYRFSYLFQPYGASQKTETTVVHQDIVERMGGIKTFEMNSALPRSQHAVIRTAGNARIISTTSHLMQRYDAAWGTWNYTMYPVPNVIEYPIGDKGGKVVYISGELSENYGQSTVNRMFVDALLDPVLRCEDDEYDIADVLGGEYYSDPSRRPNSINQINLNMVVYNNGITVPNNKMGADQSFVFTVTERLAPSVAPQIDSSGDPKLAVSLYDSDGALVATRTAIPGDSSIGFAVPAARNTVAGDWKCVVEDVHGFDGERVVLLATVDGQFDINKEMLDDIASELEQEKDQTIPAVVGTAKIAQRSLPNVQNGEKLYPRGVQSGVLYRQLGDGRIEVGRRISASAPKFRSASHSVSEEHISKVSFGPLVVSRDVGVWREDDDLVIEVADVNDRVCVAEWFKNGGVNEVSFVDGSMSAAEIKAKAAAREPEIYFTPALTETVIRGTDGNDRLEGKGKNILFLGGKGDDVFVATGGTSVFYYRRGDGHDTVISRKAAVKDMNVLRFDKDIVSADVNIDRSGNDMIFTVAGGSITVKGGFSEEVAQLDRVEFFNGEVWDARDLAKRSAGEPIQPRRMHMELPEAGQEKVPHGGSADPADADAKRTASGCKALGGNGAFLLLAVFAAVGFRKRRHNAVSSDLILK